MGGEVALDHQLSPEALAAYVFLDIAIVLIVARLAGALFRRMRQPAVIGEIIAGIMLGPSLLGQIPLGDGRQLGTTLFPMAVRPSLATLASVGLILFMFIVGLELNLRLIRGNERLAGTISLSSVALPFGLGVLLANVLYPAHRGDSSFLAFALFIGVSMSITAFPVLARILTERSMHRIPLGVIALAAAAVDDILAWSLLAVVTGVAEGTDQRHLLVMLAGSIAFVAAMLFVVRPMLRRLADRYRRAGRLTPDVLAVVLIGLLLSSYLTSKIGIHAIFGAFMFGAIMPREGNSGFFEAILRHIEQISVLLFLPLFFVTTGFNVDLRGLGTQGLGELGLILLVACSGKFFGAAGAARLHGLPTRTSTALGVLMNTRGLTELVILTVGREKGVLDRDLFTLLVVMAVVTTVITEPLLRVAYPDRLIKRDIDAADRAALAAPPSYRVLVATDDVGRVQPLADVAVALVRGREPAQIVLSHFRLTPGPNQTLGISSGMTTELAEIAESLEVLNRVAGSINAEHTEAVVLERASRSMSVDLPTQAATAEADVVLVDVRVAADWRAAARAIVAQRSARLLVADFSPAVATANRCVCLLAGDRADAAVLDVAVRLAIGSSADLLLVDASGAHRGSRRVESFAGRLRRAGVTVETGAPEEDSRPRARFVVAALSKSLLDDRGAADTVRSPAAELTVLVHQSPDQDDELGETLRQLRDPAGPVRS